MRPQGTSRDWRERTLTRGRSAISRIFKSVYLSESVPPFSWNCPLTLGEIAAPLWLHRETVRPEWVDYNGHMNVAYYVLVFDHATDAVLDYLDLGAAYRAASGCSVFVAEAHVTYDQEVNAGDPLRITSRVIGCEGKKLILFHEMFRADAIEPAATNEVLCLHVDLAHRRSAPLPVAAAERLKRVAFVHNQLPKPTRVGRAIALTAGRPGHENRQ